MHLNSSIVVPQTPQQVWALFEDPYFLPKWDRSVAEIIPTSANHHAVVGFTFDTVAPKKSWQKQGLRMSYRITENIPGYQTKIKLENSPMFKEAVWTMRFEAAPGGTLISCLADLELKLRYIFMAPLLWLNKGALLTDLSILKGVIANHYPNH
ncbi:MAG: SRPBCC family protein [Bacteroidota bacterium]